MRFRLTILALAPFVTWLLVSVTAQETRDADWPLHNLDLKNSRFSPVRSGLPSRSNSMMSSAFTCAGAMLRASQ